MSRRSILRASSRVSRRRARRISRLIAAGGASAGVALAASGSAEAATFQVTNTDESGGGSLRNALNSLGSGDPGDVDTITFASSVTGTIDLGSSLSIGAAVDIQGPGRDVLTIDGSGAGGGGGIFVASDFDPGAAEDVTISGLTLQGGDRDEKGGALYSRYNSGSDVRLDITISDSRLVGNHANEDGGAVAVDGDALTIRDSTFSGNTIGGGQFGAAVYANETSADGPQHILIEDSRFTGNASSGDGGAVYVADLAGPMVIRGSTFSGNTAADDAGGISVNGPTNSSLLIEDSTISGNTSQDAAGGLWILGLSGQAVISNTTISGNTAEYGGGISSYQYYDGPVIVRNSTIAGNKATDTGGGGGISKFGVDKPAFFGDDTFVLTSTIVAGNTAPAGPGSDLTANGGADNPTFILSNSLVGDTSGATIAQAPAGSNVLNQGAQLGSLADNGGPTQTMLPAETSPVVNAGVGNGLATDQRGLDRTVPLPGVPLTHGSDGTDIGAVELQDSSLYKPRFKAKKKQKVKGKKVVVKVKGGAGEPATVSSSDAKIKIKKKAYKLSSPSKNAAAGKLVQLKLKPTKKKFSRKILKQLKKGKKAKAIVPMKIADEAGFAAAQRVTVKLKARSAKKGKNKRG